jgi:carbamoyltransferase
MPKAILGISAFYHDSAAAVIVDGEIIAATHEERFTRIKHDPNFPIKSIEYCLQEAGLQVSDLDAIAFYDKPYLKFERLLETYHSFAPKGLISFLSAIPVWIKEKIFMKKMIWDDLNNLDESLLGDSKKANKVPLLFPEHHLSHGASAFYPSPYEDAAIMTIDGVGEWATTTICHGQGKEIKILKELPFPHSIGLLYSAFTYYCGFKVNSGEYKLMGLAPYGIDGSEQVEKFKKATLEHLIDLKPDGSIVLNMKYFNFATGLTMCVDHLWENIFDLPKRPEESEIDQNYMNMALAIQQVTNEIVLRLAKTAQKLTGSKNIVMAGGVALNCVANGILVRDNTFDNLWIQPAAGDAGGAVGAAYAGWHLFLGQERTINPDEQDKMRGSFLGPEYSDLDVVRAARKFQAPNKKHDQFQGLCDEVSELLAKGEVVGWFQGRAEWGPRALGNRTILGDPRHPEMQKKLNLKIKYREGFRPFAPSVVEEKCEEYFDLKGGSPYMLLIAPVQESRWKEKPQSYDEMELYEKLYHHRSDVPAITHIDYSARIQTVSKKTNPRYHQLISTFGDKTGYGLVVNTSFNVRGEPPVLTPEDAYRCFMRTEMDYLVVNDRIFSKSDQPVWDKDSDWQEEFKLD